MHIHFFLLFLTIVTISGLATDVSKAAGSGSVLAGSALAGEMKPAEALADFDLMRALLEEAHAGLYRYSTKAEMDRTFDGQRAKLDHSMTKDEFMAVVAETLATIHCGHTSCDPDDDTQKETANARLFPLRVRVDGTRLMVLLNDTPDDHAIPPGMEILEINGRKVADILERIWRTESADGDIVTGKSMHIPGHFAKLYRWLVDKTNDFTIKAVNGAGQTVTAKLTGVTDAERKSNHNPLNDAVLANIEKLKWSRDNAALRFLKDPDIAEIRLQYFVGHGFRQWVEQTFKSLKEKATKTLILDLRRNGGGKDEYGAMLVSYLTDKPFGYFDHINVKTIAPSVLFKSHSDWSVESEGKLREGTVASPSDGYLVTPRLHSGVSEQLPGKYPFLGKVFVLIDGGTFSTAADFCAVTHHLKRATFIGEETGGGYYGNNSGLEPKVTLPNSNLRVRVPMYEYWNAVSGYDGKRRGTIPDYMVATTTSNLLRGVDAQLDLALKLAETSSRSNK